MALDIRLACLRDAIRENWEDLEATEENRILVIRIKGSRKVRMKTNSLPQEKK